MFGTEQGDNNLSEERKKYWETLPGDTMELVDEDSRLFLHQALSTPVMNIVSRVEGQYLFDHTGKRYLDLHGNGVHNAGFSNPNVVKAIKEQLDSKLSFSPRRYSNKPAIDFARKLVEVTPVELTRVSFCPGGAEANEMALMIAKHVTGNWKTISFWDSYHGNTMGAASVGGEEHFSIGHGPMIPGNYHVEFPNYYRNPWGFDEKDCEKINRAYIRQIENVFKRNPDIAALIGEPISATPVIPDKAYWEEINHICHHYGTKIIFDEVIEGFGRTGKLFACEHFITPDILVLGKSMGGGILPFAGVVAKENCNILQCRSVGHYTHEKNPVCCAAGLAELNYIMDNNLVENAKKLGDYLLEGLLELKQKYPIIGNVAGKGLHVGVDLVKDRLTKERAVKEAGLIMVEAMKRGLAFKIIEGNIITMRPSLVITKDDADFVLTTLDDIMETYIEKINN